MATSLPRIITVDPTGSIPQQVRGAVDLMDRLIVQIDVPGAEEALNEVARGDCTAIISAWDPGDNMPGWELAAKIKKASPDTAIIILADYDDISLDEEMQNDSPFVYMQRPLNVPRFLRVLRAALDREDIFEAATAPVASGGGESSGPTFSPVPDLNVDKATTIVHQLMLDLNAMAILLVDREGEVLVEQGTIGYIDRDELAESMVPGMISNLDLREIVGGNCSALQFYDGSEADVYMITAGFHHFMAIIFDGKNGSRHLGAVSRYGRQAAEDIIGILGANAWFIQRIEDQKEDDQKEVVRKSQIREAAARKKPAAEEQPVELAPAEIHVDEPEPETVIEKMDAIDDSAFDPDAIFDMDMDESSSDDMFSLENMEELASDADSPARGAIDWEQAQQLGLLDS